MDIHKHTEFNLLREEVEELRQQSKSLESGNRTLTFGRNFEGSSCNHIRRWKICK